jgi:hypothetical protein
MPHCQITLTLAALQNLVHAPVDGTERLVLCPAGHNRLPGRLEWLVHRTLRPGPGFPPATPAVIVPTRRPDRLRPALHEALRLASTHAPTAVLALGVGPTAGLLAGLCCVEGAVVPLNRVVIAGPGLPAVALAPAGPSSQKPHPSKGPPDEEVWSRTIGALGATAWRRLSHLRVAVVGCGRSGSLAATALRRLGVHHLALIDPDHLEPHNLGEMDAVGLDDVGRPKAEALARALTASLPGLERLVEPVPESVLSLPGLAALKQADLVVDCADRGSARLATAFLAALYLKPLLDIGTGVLAAPGPASRQMGADVRLVLPGRCLLCLGGVANLDEARRELLAGPGATTAQRPWYRNRAGSLRSLNGIAVNLGLRLLEDLAASLRTQSTWLHFESDSTGLPRLEHRQASAVQSCRLCALTGAGDEGVGELPGVLAGL